jgi:predicted nucleic acid-binding protein
MKAVFADAFYFVARLNRHDQHHERVVAFSRSFRARFVTTDWVLMEVADALAKSEARTRAGEFIAHLRQSPVIEILPASRDAFDRALELYRQHADKHWTLTDCVSFVVMRDRGLFEALTADHHFQQAGFTALLKCGQGCIGAAALLADPQVEVPLEHLPQFGISGSTSAASCVSESCQPR